MEFAEQVAYDIDTRRLALYRRVRLSPQVLILKAHFWLLLCRLEHGRQVCVHAETRIVSFCLCFDKIIFHGLL